MISARTQVPRQSLELALELALGLPLGLVQKSPGRALLYFKATDGPCNAIDTQTANPPTAANAAEAK